MAQAKTKRDPGPPLREHVSRALREVGFLLLLGLTLYLFIALMTYNAADPGWSHSGSHSGVDNSGGVVGAWFADIVFWLFGYFA